MKPSEIKLALRSASTIRAIQERVPGASVASPKPQQADPIALVPIPLARRNAAAKVPPAIPMDSALCFFAPSEGENWAMGSHRSGSFASSSAALAELPLLQTSQMPASKQSRRKRPLRSPVEPTEARQMELLPTQVDNRHLTFACPACHYFISLAKAAAGQKARCPQCTSAIRAPQLNTLGPAYSYERSMESLLHPEHFHLHQKKPRTILGLPLPQAHHWFIGVGVILLGCFAHHVPSLHENADSGSQIITLDSKRHQASFDSVSEAELIVRSFLFADGWESKARYVHDPIRVGSLMQEFYEREAGGAAKVSVRVEAAAPTHYYFSEQSQHLQSVVEAEMSDGAVRHFLVEFFPWGPKVDWEASVAYAPVSWAKMMQTAQSDGTYLQRVSVCLDDYYNYEFNDRSKYISLYLEDPITGKSLGNGYLRRDSADATEAINALATSKRDSLQRVMIEVQPQPTSAKHRLIQITRFVKSGFKNPAPSTVASVQ